MKKNELRVAIQEMDTYQFGLKNELHNKLTKVTSYVPKKEVIDLLNQLEEPEQEKVVIPQFVADYYETVKYLVLSAQFDKFKYAPDKKVWNWYRECEGKYPNPEANAQLVISMIKLGRYEVEKEKLYHVPLHDGTYLVSDDDKNLSKATTYFMHQEDNGFLNRLHIFTEQEIKSIDERYWTFAEEITK